MSPPVGKPWKAASLKTVCRVTLIRGRGASVGSPPEARRKPIAAGDNG